MIGTKKLRYGVIGLKGIGKRHFQAVREDNRCDLVGVADIDEVLVTRIAQELDIHAYTDYRVMLEKEALDAVSIATPHHLHASMGIDCLNAGVHVFMEKPLAIRVSEADHLIQVAKKNNLKLGVCHQLRTFRSAQALKRVIDSGSIGKMMRVLWTWGHLRYQNYYDKDPWRRTFRDSGGGMVMSMAIHDIDLLCWLIGKPVQVSALLGNQLHNTEIEDVACIQVVFANGALGSIQFTLNQPKGYSIRQFAGDRGVIVMPDVKSLWSDVNDQILLGTFGGTLQETVAAFPYSTTPDPAITWEAIALDPKPSIRKSWPKLLSRWKRLVSGKKKTKPHPVGQLVKNFIDAVVTGDEPLVTGESAHAAIEVINAIYLSALRKKTVDLPLDRAEYDQLFEELVSGKAKIPRLQ